MATSSFNKIFTHPLRKSVLIISFLSGGDGGGEGGAAPTPFYKQASGQIFKDDVKRFSSTSDICFFLGRLASPCSLPPVLGGTGFSLGLGKETELNGRWGGGGVLFCFVIPTLTFEGIKRHFYAILL
jgi:hypothetical protein